MGLYKLGKIVLSRIIESLYNMWIVAYECTACDKCVTMCV